jgi:hypothetical protein
MLDPKITWARIERCPKSCRCSAPICPLDPDWRLRVHLKGEPVCHWLRCLVKPGGRAILGGCVPTEVAQAIVGAHSEVIARYAPIKFALKRAAKSGFRSLPVVKEISVEIGDE